MVRILVVDDSTTMQKVVRIAFTKYDAQVFAVSSIAQALAHLSSQPHPNLLIIDSAISGVNSLSDIVRLKKELTLETKFLLLTSTHFQIDENRFKENSFEFFLKKPFESTELVSMAGSLLGAQLQLKSSGDSSGVPRVNSMSSQEGQSPQTQLPPPPVSFNLDLKDESQKNAAFNKTVLIPPPPGGFGQSSFDILIPNASLSDSDNQAVDNFRVTQEIKLPPPPSIPFNPANFSDSKSDVDFSNPFPNQSHMDSLPRPPIPMSQHSIGELEVQKQLRKLVEEYCQKNFASIAKEVISNELRKLADEKARSLLE